MRLFLLRKPRNLETRRINCNAKKVRQQVSNFSCDFHCSKTVLTFFLQIIWSKWLLTIVLNVKRCFNTNKQALSSAYLLITEILHLLKLWRWYSSTKNFEKQQQQDRNPCFMFTIIFVYKIIVMIDDAFRCNTCLTLYQRVVVKWLLHRKYIGKIRNFIILSWVAPIEALFISLCMAFEGLHGSIKFFFCDVRNRSYNGFILCISMQT